MRAPGFLRNRPLIITIALVVALVMLIIFTSPNRDVTAVESVAGAAVTPVNRGFTSFFDSVSNFFTNMFNPTKAEAENVELKKQVTKLQEDATQLEELQNENQRLRDLLGFVQKNQQYVTVAASITNKEPGIWFDTFVINVGRDQGVDKDMAVVNVQGLVGRVIESGSNWSKVMAVIDARSSVSVLLERSRADAIVQGTFSSADSTGLCKMSFLNADANVLPGDKVITSGLGGVYPKGLPVGEVVELGNKTENTSRRVMIKPAVNFDHLEEVLVIKQETDTPTQENDVTTPATGSTPQTTGTSPPKETGTTPPKGTSSPPQKTNTPTPKASATPGGQT